MPASRSSRRDFCSAAAYGWAALLLAKGGPLGTSGLAGQMLLSPPATPTRPDVAAIDHDRILSAAKRHLAEAPTPLTSLPCPRSPGTEHDYYSEAEPEPGGEDLPPAKTAPLPPAFTAHRDALFALGLAVPALAAAYLLTGEEPYAEHAVLQLRGWFVDPATRMTPRLDYGQVTRKPAAESLTIQTSPRSAALHGAYDSGRFEGILETLPLVEIAQAIPFLASSPALTEADRNALDAWFQAYLHWLTDPQDSGPRLAALARDRKDHHGTSWLLQASAYASLLAPAGDAPRAEDSKLAELRHRFRTVTLRAQINANGTFPHELSSPAPYRDSLFNLDMMAAICHLLSTRFDSVWEYQLEDGPGMRSAIAYHFPFIADRATWPFRSDATHFKELPGRRASLLLTARAYQRPEYAALWTKLPPDAASPEIMRTLTIHQPLLWVRQAGRA
jgi:hypothetical protein